MATERGNLHGRLTSRSRKHGVPMTVLAVYGPQARPRWPVVGTGPVAVIGLASADGRRATMPAAPELKYAALWDWRWALGWRRGGPL
jgi:hypothetical protein